MPRLSKIGAAALAAFGWTGLSSVTASYLVVAGGGGGAPTVGGGGGAGGYQAGTTSLNPTLSYTVTVGAGGAGGANAAIVAGNQGSDSSFSTITANAGGKGGIQGGATDTSGGSSGGAGGFGTRTGTASQGNLGGTTGWSGAGGGGAGGVGADTPNSNANGGAGGAGTANSISGTSVTYAGGGGGGSYRLTGGAGGSGGGGTGGTFNGANATAGTANTGGGGGGGSDSGSTGSASGAGGSGVVIISYVGAQQFGGGVVTSSGGNTIHTFTTSGTLSPLSSLTASTLVVAGGGGGGSLLGGGGGAGGYRTGSGITIDTNSIYVVTVGAGGAGAIASGNGLLVGAKGGSSTFLATTSAGGGEGGSNNATVDGQLGGGGSGGSGGGAGPRSTTAAAGNTPSTSPSQGNNGGIQGSFTVNGGSGGGGANAVGGNLSGTAAGSGGAGTANSISGSSVTYAGGGGGGGRSSLGGTAGSGGAGGGGSGTADNSTGSAGTANLGGGGGGGGFNGTEPGGAGGAGGSGVVIISYPGSTQQMAGGTVTVAGGNVIHTFTSSGYLTPIVLVNNSLRFRSSVSAYLNRTPTNVATSRRIMTYSAWVKIGTLGTQRLLYEGYTSVSDLEYFMFNSSNQLEWSGQVNGGTSYGVRTPAVFRDPSAWYHVVIAIDTTQATDTNRIKIYVNGVQQTGLTTFYSGFPAQNTDLEWNNQSSTQVIGWGGHTGYYDGYMADINMVDGQALTPNSFGTSNGLGVWQPIRYGGSYGTNGFYLPFTNTTNTTTLGLDSSPQNNNWTANNFSLARSSYTSYTSSSGTYTVPAGVTSLSYLVVAGGGGGASWGGGGGAGGLLQGTMAVTGGQTIAYSVGAGGAGALSTGSNGTSGSNSTFGSLTAIGGGGGTANTTVQSGGSGGGSAFGTSGGPGTLIGLGTAGQGNNGGLSSATVPYQSGGGGAGAVGANAVSGSGAAGNGGAGLAWVNGTTYAGGGGGGGGVNAGGNWNGGSGGSGGGGAGGTGGVGTSGTANTGGGGGASGRSTNTFFDAGNGGSGIIIIGTGSASTYDSMTDVPTLTSATVANYCVLNPLSKGANVSATNGNLNAVISGASAESLQSTLGMSSGKWYCEMTAGGGGSIFGITTVGANLSSWVGSDSKGYGYRGDTAQVMYNGSALVSGMSSFTSGDVISLAFDADAGKLWFAKNGTWYNSGSPSAGTNATVSSVTTNTWFVSVGRINTTNDAQFNFGQQPFTYTPPTGFVALNTFNLPTPTIGVTAATQANKYMDATTYTGTGSSQLISNAGLFQPNFVWIKQRSAAGQHNLMDVLRTGTRLRTDDTAAESDSSTLFSFASTGFNVLTSNASYNQNTGTYVAWQWKASDSGVTNTAGSITSTVSANTTAGFSIVTYTGNATSGATVGHGLGVAPSMVILKSRSVATNWYVYHSGLTSAAYQVYLNLTSGQDNSVTTAFNSVAPGATTFTLPGTGFGSNNSGATYVAYCFAQVAGYSAFGSYTGNGSTDGPFIFTGFRPRFVLLKVSSGTTANWVIVDTSRNTYNVANSQLNPDASDAEFSGSNIIDIVSNGFKLRNTPSTFNGNGNTYIYAAFAENPFKYANAR